MPAGGQFGGGGVPVARVRGEKVWLCDRCDGASAEVRVGKSATDEVSSVRGGVRSVW